MFMIAVIFIFYNNYLIVWPCRGGAGVLLHTAEEARIREERETVEEGGGGLFLSSGPRIKQRTVPVRWQHPAYSQTPHTPHHHPAWEDATDIFEGQNSFPVKFSASVIFQGFEPPRLPVRLPPLQTTRWVFSAFPDVIVWWEQYTEAPAPCIHSCYLLITSKWII